MPDFGKHIAQLRKFKKLTQAEFALKANINYRHFQKIEGNKTDIRMSTASEIARVLGVPVHSLSTSRSIYYEIRRPSHDLSWRRLHCEHLFHQLSAGPACLRALLHVEGEDTDTTLAKC